MYRYRGVVDVNAGTGAGCGRRQMLLCAAAFAIGSGASSAATAQQAVPSGNIILLRDVAPRSAVTPGTGEALSVRAAPAERIFGHLKDVRHLTDSDAAEIIGALPAGTAVNGAIHPGGDRLSDAGSVIGSVERSSSAGLSGTISGAVGLGLGALNGALGATRQALGSDQ